LINIIFEKQQTAISICKKLCKEFVSPRPDDDFVAELANVFIENNFELTPTLSYLFKSAYFYSDEVIATKIKSPVDFLLGTLKLLQVEVNDFSYIKQFTGRLGQEIFNPPDVRGWEGQRKWLNSTTYLLRNEFIHSLFTGVDLEGNPLPIKIDILKLVRSFSSSENAEQFVEEASQYLFQYPISQEKKKILLDILLGGLDSSYYSTYNDKAEDKLTSFFKTALTFSEYQLH
jgi:uncharacterized protein (DUF1800 family)